MPLSDNASSIFWKIDDAVAGSDPFVANMPKNRLSVLLVFTSSILTVKGLIFSKSVTFEPSVNRENGLQLMAFTVSLTKCGACGPLIMYQCGLRCRGGILLRYV